MRPRVWLGNPVLRDHLGNVLTVVTDLKIGISQHGVQQVKYYLADVVSVQDYYAFGSLMPARHWVDSERYRYGFQSQECDNEWMGEGNAASFEYRVHDARIGRFLSVDPLARKYASNTPYLFAGNDPIMFIDLAGKEGVIPPMDAVIVASISAAEIFRQLNEMVKETNDGIGLENMHDVVDNNPGYYDRSGRNAVEHHINQTFASPSRPNPLMGQIDENWDDDVSIEIDYEVVSIDAILISPAGSASGTIGGSNSGTSGSSSTITVGVEGNGKPADTKGKVEVANTKSSGATDENHKSATVSNYQYEVTLKVNFRYRNDQDGEGSKVADNKVGTLWVKGTMTTSQYVTPTGPTQEGNHNVTNPPKIKWEDK